MWDHITYGFVDGIAFHYFIHTLFSLITYIVANVLSILSVWSQSKRVVATKYIIDYKLFSCDNVGNVY